MPVEYHHIFLTDTPLTRSFTNPSNGGGDRSIPERERSLHSSKLRDQWNRIWDEARTVDEDIKAISIPTNDGVYVEFTGLPGFDLITKSLENRRAGIYLHNVRTTEDSEGKETVRATLYIPSRKRDWFLNKIDEYAEEETIGGIPKNDPLIRSIENIKIAILESFWTDNKALLPREVSAWCETWLLSKNDEDVQHFRENARALDIEVGNRCIKFPDRTVLLTKLSNTQLSNLIKVNPKIAEFRRAKAPVKFFIELDNKEQSEWVNDLRSRLIVNSSNDIAICLLDTGVNNGHLLLQPILFDSDLHAINPDWEHNDNSVHGHGTLMSGVAIYGDLSEILASKDPIIINHRLESVKILPPIGENPPDLYGDITIQGVNRVEIEAPQRTHIACMAVTSQDGRDRGKPSSWSAAIDKLTSGYDDDKNRLFILSAGNIDDQLEWASYPISNITNSIHDPGQSWNAITVGAYTQKTVLSEPEFEEYIPLAGQGELSPFSTTSCEWDGNWPIKPDIVLEGGNLARDPDGFISKFDDLSLLSTGSEPTKSQFGLINATSAASALAARMAAQIQALYPYAWPETIRGLMIHSAEWPDSLIHQILPENDHRKLSKTEIKKLLRICGYGVPNQNRAIACKSNILTLISESEMQPFTRNGSRYVSNEMHLHKLPWPDEVLLDLGETPVTLRITLSYFIEPGPGEVGWKDKYRYASHVLRFDLNNPGETEEIFIQRLNAAARDDDEPSDYHSGSKRWVIGKNNRNKGSVQSDFWQGNAADLAATNLVGIFPAVGWWRERPWLNRWNRKTRYSLIVSVQTPEESMDVYTPVAIKLIIPIQISL